MDNSQTSQAPRPDQSATMVAALVAAQTLARPVGVGVGIPAAVLPPGYSLQLMERTMETPFRDRGDFSVVTAEAFNSTVNLYRDRGIHLPIFFARTGTTAVVRAVLNAHTWRDFSVTLMQNLSEPFLDWYQLNTLAQPQRKFALFLEERTAHVVKPEGAALLELARKFKATVTVRFQSVVESENGDNSLEFIQLTDAGSASAKGRMKAPDRITLCLPVWHGGEPVRFDARFAYTIVADGKLTLSFEILGLNELLTVELRKIVARIGKAHENAVVIEGSNAPVPSLVAN